MNLCYRLFFIIFEKSINTRELNNGELPKYVIDDAHVPIISETPFVTVQAEVSRRNQSTTDVQELTKTGAKKYSGKYASGIHS